VIVPILVERDENESLKNWLKEWKVSPCSCIRVINLLDTSRNTKIQAEELRKELISGVNGDKKIVTHVGEFGSPGAARNEGLSRSSADWVAFWDSDDAPKLHGLEFIIDQVNLDRNFIHVFQYETWSVADRSLVGVSKDSNNLKLARHPGLWRMIIPGDIARSFRFPEWSMGEDVNFLLQLILSQSNHEIKFHSEILYRYKINQSGQLTSNKVALKGMERALKEICTILKKEKKLKRKNANLAFFILVNQYLSLIKRQPLAGIRQFSAFLSVSLITLTRVSSQNYGSRRDVSAEIAGYVYLTGGLGNQLFQLAAAKYYCGYDRKLAIISDAGSPRLDVTGHPEVFEIVKKFDNNVTFIELGRSRRLFAKFSNILLRNNIHENKLFNNWLVERLLIRLFQPVFMLILKRMLSILVCHGHGFSSKKFDKTGPKLMVGYFQSFEYANVIAEELVEKLGGVYKKVSESKLILREVDHDALAIHMRRGDYMKEDKIGCLSDSYFKKAITLALSLQKYRELWFIVEEEDMISQILPLESDLPYKIFTTKDFNSTETLILMSMASGHVISNSTFSWWGAYLSYINRRNGNVIAPNPWFKNMAPPDKLTPREWILLDAEWINQ